MKSKLEEVIQKCTYKMDDDLPSLIWTKIKKREKKMAKIKLYAFSTISIFSVIGFIPMFKILLNNLAQSGFYEYLSIAFSDSNTIAMYWKEFIFSLTESLPVMSLAYTFMFVFIFFFSLRYIAKQIIESSQLNSRSRGNKLSFNY